MPRRSDLVLLPFPFSDLSSAKRRPVLVLRNPNRQGDFLAAQVTSQLHHQPAVPLADDHLKLGMLPKTSIVRTDKVFTLSASLIVRRIGVLSEPAFDRVLRAVCLELGCKIR